MNTNKKKCYYNFINLIRKKHKLFKKYYLKIGFEKNLQWWYLKNNEIKECNSNLCLLIIIQILYIYTHTCKI